MVSTDWERAPTAVGVVEAAATTIETEAFERAAEMRLEADAFDGDPLTYAASEESDKVE